jgi:hypothetical protein
LKESVVLADIQHRELGKMNGKAGEALGLSQDAKTAKIYTVVPNWNSSSNQHNSFSISQPTKSPGRY